MLVGSKRSTRPWRARKPAVKSQFLALDVVDDGRARPGQGADGTTSPHPLARPGRRKAEHMPPGPSWRQVVLIQLAQHERHRNPAARLLPPRTASPNGPNHRYRHRRPHAPG